ncbi:MAG: universal stress protein [bacterium]
MNEFEEVMVPVDGSESAERAALFGARLAAALECTLTLAHVVALTSESVMAMAKMSKEEIQGHQQQIAKVPLEQAQAAIAGLDIHVTAEPLVLIGDPAEEILNYLSKHPKTLVVMGRRGQSGIRRLAMGGVSDKVIRYADGPVTLVT